MFAFFNWLSFDWVRGKSTPLLDTIPEEEFETPISNISQDWQEAIQTIDDCYSSFPIASVFALCVLENLNKSRLACPTTINKLTPKNGIIISWLNPCHIDWQIIEINDPTSFAKIASLFTVHHNMDEEILFQDRHKDVAAYLAEKLDNQKLNRFAKDQN